MIYKINKNTLPKYKFTTKQMVKWNNKANVVKYLIILKTLNHQKSSNSKLHKIYLMCTVTFVIFKVLLII